MKITTRRSLKAWHIPLAAVITSLALAACGGGNNDTVPPRTADVRFSDMHALNVSRVSVLDQNDKELYAASLDCSQSFNCRMQLQDYKPPQQLTFKVYNQGNQLVSASDFYETNTDIFFVPNSDTLLGAYLFRNYAKRYAITPVELSASLSKFFQNTHTLDTTLDIFNSLGRLYQTERQDPKLGYGETQFIDELKKRLDSEVVLVPGYLIAKLNPIVGDIEIPVCPPALKIFVAVLTSFGKKLPFVPGLEGLGEDLGDAIGKTAGGVFNAGCAAADSREAANNAINKKLDALKLQLTELTAKMNAMGYRLEHVQQVVEASLAIEVKGEFERSYNATIGFINLYSNLLNPSGKAPYGNINDYVKANGGLKESNFPPNSALYRDLLSKLNEQREKFTNLASSTYLRGIATALQLTCDDQMTILGDVLAQRASCNLYLAQITAQYAGAQAQLATMMKDQISMINQQYAAASAKDKAWIEKTFVSAFGTTFDKAEAEVNKALIDNLTLFTSSLGESFVPVNKGLPDNVAKGLRDVALCRSNDTTEPAVSEWYTQTTQTDNYLVVYCENSGRMVKSKFYYDANDEASLYKNVLGVPVVARTSNRFTDRSTPWFTAGFNSGSDAVVSLVIPDDPAQRGLAVKVNPKEIQVNNEPFPPTTNRVLSVATYRYTETCTSDSCGGQNDHRYLMLRESALTGSSFEYFTSRFNNDSNVLGENYIAATLAYTVPTGTGVDSASTLVWQVELTGSNSIVVRPYRNQWRLRCLTADCSVEGDHLAFKNNSGVKTISLIGPDDGWKSFYIKR